MEVVHGMVSLKIRAAAISPSACNRMNSIGCDSWGRGLHPYHIRNVLDQWQRHHCNTVLKSLAWEDASAGTCKRCCRKLQREL